MSRRPRSTQRISVGLASALAAWLCPCVLALEAAQPDAPIVNPLGPIEIDTTPPPVEQPPSTQPPVDTAEAEADAATSQQPITQEVVGPPVDAIPPTSQQGPQGESIDPRPVPPQESTPLGRAENADRSLGPPGSGVSPGGKGGWIKQTGAALAVVIGLIFIGRFGLVALARKSGGLSAMLGAGGRASGVMEILARYPVSRGHTLVLLKVDRRVLVLCHTSSGFTTLTEFIEPEEVASILMRVRDDEGESMAARFSEMLHELSDGTAASEDDPVSPRMALSRDAEPERERWPALRNTGGVGGGLS